MIDVLSLSLALSVGQGQGLPPQIVPQPVVQQRTIPNALPSTNYPRQMPSLLTGDQKPMALPAAPMTPTIQGAPMGTPMGVVPKMTTPMGTTPLPAAPMGTPAPAVTSNGTAAPAATNGGCANCEEKKEEEAEEEEPTYFFMNLLEGTHMGAKMKEKGVTIGGWLQFSYTASNNVDVTNQPVVWNDRANRFLMQQAWLRIDKAIDTESKEVNFGYRADILFGTDYRFTLPRGLLNDQLKNTQGQQNLYGVDPIQFYVNAWLPNLGNGTEVRAGRLYTPFGYESVEGPTSPLLSRSYAFNWCPPFTHMGVQFDTKLNDRFSTKLMLANGNDVFIDPSQEFRVVGTLGYTSEDEKTAATFGYSIGRGKFNAGDPFAPQTVSLMSENAGRNNINVFDFVLTRKVSDDFTYGLEVIYGYQYGVPTTVALPTVGSMIKNNATHGTAHWGSIVNYFTYTFNEKTTGIVRAEAFDDFEGQRTGFEGLYTAITGGIQYKPNNWLMVRPELRYDYNHESRPFEGNRSLFTAAADLIIRY